MTDAQSKIIRKFFVVRTNGFRPETDNKAKLRQDFRDIDIGATSLLHDKLRTLLGVKVQPSMRTAPLRTLVLVELRQDLSGRTQTNGRGTRNI